MSDTSNYWLAMWDEFGFESILDITEFAPTPVRAMKILSGDPVADESKLSQVIFNMEMRARVNSQREYEIYGFMSTEDIGEDVIKEWAKTNPQTLVDFIRKNGHCILNKTATKERKIS